MTRLLSTVILLAWSFMLQAAPPSRPESLDSLYAYYRAKGNLDSALTVLDMQVAQAQAAGDAKREGEARWKKIALLHSFSQADPLIKEADTQMAWFKNHGQWDYYYRSWQRKTNILTMQGKLRQALHELQRMLNDATERDNRSGRAMAYKQISVIYLNMKQTEPAVDALQHYFELVKDDADVSTLSNYYYRMAKAYDYDRNYDRELSVTRDWKAFIHANANKRDGSNIMECYNTCYQTQAAAYIGLQRLDNAAQALDSALYYARRGNTSLGWHHYYKMMARYHMARGDAEATLRYTDSIRIVTTEKDDHAAELRAEALMMTNRGLEAARIYQQLYHEKDSIFGRETRQHLDELNTLFQVDEIKTEQQHAKLRYLILASVCIVLALLVLVLYGWRAAIRQKRVNEELREANERAKVSAKMKSEFIRNISHEIRTPLNIVSGFTQILTGPDQKELSDEAREDIKARVDENTERITKLVDSMLELSDVSSEVVISRNDETTAHDLAAEAIATTQIDQHTKPGNAEAKVAFSFKTDSDAAAITLHTNSLYAVRTLSHLLGNAMKFTSEGSITLRVEDGGSTVHFYVEDTGIGIAKEEAEHIFEEFVQLDEFTEGAGIGLAVARSLARRMGGDLWLDTDYTDGARFVFELTKN